MREPQGKDKVPYRKHLEFAARKGSEFAIAELEGPDVPAYMEYLWDIFMDLDQHREIGFNGPAVITYQALDAYTRLMDRPLAPYEVKGLTLLDAAIRHPEAFKDDA